MSSTLTMGMINNAALLLALSIIYEISYIFKIKNRILSQLSSGVLIGLFGIAIMSLSSILTPGLFFDTRSVLISVAALTFGVIPASVAAAITIIYRLSIGGIGTMMGVSVILCSYGLGLIWRRFVKTEKSKLRWLKLYAFGICVHLAMLSCTFLLPLDSALNTLNQIVVPVMSVYPVAVVLLSLLLLHQIEYREEALRAAEADQRYRSLFYNNHAVMLLIDPESGAILDASPAAAAFYGWPVDVLKTMNISKINTMPPAEIQASMQKTVTAGGHYFHFRHNKASGDTVDVEVYSGPIEADGKKLLYSIVHDISERTTALKALQESEARYRTLVDNAPYAIFEIEDNHFTYLNKAGLKLLGAEKPEDLLGKSAIDVIHPDYMPISREYMQALDEGRAAPHSGETAYIRLDQSIVFVEGIALHIHYGDKKGVLVFARDISERRAAIKALQESEVRFRTLVDNAPDAIFEIEDKQIIFVNKAGQKLLGAESPEQLLGKDALDILHPDSRADALTYMQKLSDNEIEPHSTERAYVRLNGSVVYVDAIAAFLPYHDKLGTLVFARDISERRAALNALQESELRFRTLVDSAPDAVLLLADRKIAFINKAGLRLLGAENEAELIGIPGLDIVHPDYQLEAIKQREQLHNSSIQPTPTERVYIRRDGTQVYVDVIVVPVMINGNLDDIIIARDISEQKRMQQKEQEMEAQLRQQQKLEAIGTLAGGVAHEINNPLNGVMNYAQLILDKVNPDSGVAGDFHEVSGDSEAVSLYAKEIIHETERISTIVKNLLQFSRQEKQSHSYASIYDIVGQTISLVNTIIKKDQIVLDIQLDENLPEIKCRSQQIQQVIMNLLTNARDAVNEKYPGYDANKIIRLRCHMYRSEGRRWLRLTVRDTGCGIQPALYDRIYEPFFSTKPKETGTGLGLSISYGIVSEHHGKISFESVVGEYTKFILDLPIDNGWTL